MARVPITRLRQLIRTLDYVVSTHGADELEDENLSILDLESIVLTGQIIGHQRDQTTRELKVVVEGTTRSGESAHAVAKIGASGEIFVITVYLL